MKPLSAIEGSSHSQSPFPLKQSTLAGTSSMSSLVSMVNFFMILVVINSCRWGHTARNLYPQHPPCSLWSLWWIFLEVFIVSYSCRWGHTARNLYPQHPPCSLWSLWWIFLVPSVPPWWNYKLLFLVLHGIFHFVIHPDSFTRILPTIWDSKIIKLIPRLRKGWSG